MLTRHCEHSLRRLRTDYIDLYMIHWPVHSHAMRHFTSDENKIAEPPVLSDVFSELLVLQAAGKIRHIGVSNFGKKWMEEIPRGVDVSINQLPYNLLCRAIEIEISPYCAGLGTGVMTYMSLFQGILAGLYKTLEEVPPWQSRTRHFNSEVNELCRHGEPGFEPETRSAIREIEDLCKETGLSMAEIAISWIIANPDITCALVGARSEKKIMQNMKAAQIALPAELVKKLNQITQPLQERMGNHFDYFEGADRDRTI
jgi:aryl-alcohol dehydrogenase-like predicted oxidoreductase